MRWTVRRRQTGRVRWWAAATAACLVAGVPVLAGSFSIMPDYTVRLVLPSPGRERPLRAGPGVRRVPAEPSAKQASGAPPPATEAPPSTAPVATAVAKPDARIPGIIPVKYNLGGGAEAGDAIELEKPVSIAGAEAGRIALRIDGNAKVFAEGRAVAALLAARGRAVPEGVGNGFVSLEALRALGVEVRYDAARDRLVLELPKA